MWKCAAFNAASAATPSIRATGAKSGVGYARLACFGRLNRKFSGVSAFGLL